MKNSSLSPHLSISNIITGLWQVADMERGGKAINIDEAARALIPYVEAGLTTFDMADHYGSAELIAGILHKKYIPKNQIQLLTKWVPQLGKFSKQEVREAVQTSLKRLQVEQLDLLQYHAWNYANPVWLDHLFYLQELRREGLISELGLTNFDTAHLKMVLDSGIQVVSNQISFSLIDQRANQSMVSLCRQYGVKILAFSTIAGGFLSKKWLGKPEPHIDTLSTWSEMKYKRFIDQSGGWAKFQKLLQVLDEVAQSNSLDIANIASLYILEHEAVGAVIIGARPSQSEHIQSNLRIIENTLSDNDKVKIRIALQNLYPIAGDCGDEYRKPPFLTASGDLSHHIEDGSPLPYSTKTGKDGRIQVLSGTVWEDLAGYCRAIKQGNRIVVSGTTATHGKQVIGGKDPTSQTHFIIDKIEGALQSVGSKLEDVIRTRIFIRNIEDWEAVAKAHGARFKDIQPVNTLVKAELIGEEYLVEIEAEAYITE